METEGLWPTVGRLQRSMFWVALVASIPVLIWAGVRAMLVLTLTVAAAIVQLRWLASQVAGLAAFATASDRPRATALTVDGVIGSDEGRGFREGDGDTECRLGGQRSLEQCPTLETEGSVSRTGTASSTASSRDHVVATADALRAPPTELSRRAVGGKVKLMMITRLPVLLGSSLVVLAVGSMFLERNEIYALAAGAATLPLSLLIEAVRAALRPSPA